MSTIHKTTLTPTKLDLLTAWLPAQPWYRATACRPPELTKVGGFRLDDPAGEVGIEFMVVGDDASGEAVFYLAPMTYRGEPLPGADDALIGTTEHGVLGHGWVYDGVRDLPGARLTGSAQCAGDQGPRAWWHCGGAPVPVRVVAAGRRDARSRHLRQRGWVSRPSHLGEHRVQGPGDPFLADSLDEQPGVTELALRARAEESP